MESTIRKIIEETTNEDLLLVKFMVDYGIIKFNQRYEMDTRNEIIMSVYSLIKKNYIANNHGRYKEHKKSIVRNVTLSYLTSKIIKD